MANGNAYISPISIAEALAYSGYTEDQAKELEEFLYNNFKILNIDKEIISKASQISRYKKLTYGKKLKMTDAIIAATSICKEFKLVTKDKEDFKNIPQIKIYD